MEEYEYRFNPCFCIGIHTGSVLISIFDMIYGVIYIGRVFLLRHMVERNRDIYPLVNTSKTEQIITRYEMQLGNYGLISVSGLVLFFIGTKSATWKALLACRFWFLSRIYLTIVLSLLTYYMIKTLDNPMYNVYGFEVLFNVLIHIYFFPIIVIYTRMLRTEIKITNLGITARKSKPRGHLKSTAPQDMRDLNDANLHELSPQLYLNVMSNYRGESGQGQSQQSSSRSQHQALDNDSEGSQNWTEDRYMKDLGGNSSGMQIKGPKLNPAAFEVPSKSVSPLKIGVTVSNTPESKGQASQRKSVLKQSPSLLASDSPSATKVGWGALTFSTGASKKNLKDDSVKHGRILDNPAANNFKQLYMGNDFVVILPKSGKSKSQAKNH